MRTIDATLDSPIMLTKTDTNITTTVRFCVKPWLESYPGCVIELIHRRNQDAGGLPAAILETDGEYAYWLVTDADTAYAGYGEAELLMKSGEAKAKSPTYTTYVDKSVASDEETPPEPIERFVEQISDAAADAINAKNDAVSAKEDAESAKTAAETAKENAETAARQAESASAHSPYIGENHHWYLWDAESETYVDTGITAEGKDGDDGISPEVTFAEIEGGHSMTVTDAEHPDGQTINIMDGADGEVPIDDTTPAADKVFSSAKVAAEVSTLNQAKQDKLVAGTGIQIAADGKTISATGGGSVQVTTVTIAAASWSDKTVTVSVTGVTADNTVQIFLPTKADSNVWNSCGIWCTAQADGTLTFSCDEVPSDPISLGVMLW